MTTATSAQFTLSGQRFELIRYSDGSGRVYHVASEAIVVESAHLAGTGTRLARDVQAWLRDPQHKTIAYARGCAGD